MKLIDHQRKILHKLSRNSYIGSKHTSEDNLIKGFPKDVRGDLKKAIKKLIKDRYLLSKPTSYGLEVSINPRMMKEINKMLEGN